MVKEKVTDIMYLKKIKNSLLYYLWLIIAFAACVLITCIGALIGGNDNPLYIVGFASAILIFFFGWITTIVSEIIALVNIIKTKRAGEPLPAVYLVFWGIEVALTVQWIIICIFVFIGSAGV